MWIYLAVTASGKRLKELAAVNERGQLLYSGEDQDPELQRAAIYEIAACRDVAVFGAEAAAAALPKLPLVGNLVCVARALEAWSAFYAPGTQASQLLGLPASRLPGLAGEADMARRIAMHIGPLRTGEGFRVNGRPLDYHRGKTFFGMAQVPRGVMTRAGLASRGLQPGGEPFGFVMLRKENGETGGTWPLYDFGEATPM